MARITIEDCLAKIPNRFQLTLSATYRARQLVQGHTAMVDAKDKPTVLALREIAAGKVRFDRPVRGVLAKRLSELQAEYEAAHGMPL